MLAEGAYEQTTIPLLHECLARAGQLAGALVSIDAVACHEGAAQPLLDSDADCLLAVKANQPGLMAEIARFFDGLAAAIATSAAVDKDHCGVEERMASVSTSVDWLAGKLRFPGEYRLPAPALIARVYSRV